MTAPNSASTPSPALSRITDEERREEDKEKGRELERMGVGEECRVGRREGGIWRG